MTVAEVIDYARYGELSQLGIMKHIDDVGTESDKVEKQILSYINLGLIELYKRFNLRTEETTITMLDATTLYTLNIPTLNNVLGAYDELGNEYALNDEKNPIAILTPTYNTVQIPNPSAGGIVYIVYNAAPTTLVWVADLTTIVVPLPPVMLEALLHYVGYRAHASMNAEIKTENNTHYMRFESSCDRLRELGTLVDDKLVQATKLEDKGFV